MTDFQVSDMCEEGARVANLRGVMSDDEIEELRKRNLERVKEKQAELGHRWVLYPTRQEQMA